ncbi:MAG: D-alanyl-D-alanine carboxypeptidase family protein [Candidatus Ornithomonoglobus sp.]
MKRMMCFFICLVLSVTGLTAFAEGEEAADAIDGVEAKSCILIEQSTGEVLREMNADEQLPIASVTKVMTMLLIMEEIDKGNLSYDDMIPVSENAMSYGGSTMFLEAGEELPVNDMLKGIAVASANDGCVAMAEYIAGSESGFVDMMNKRAQELGMTNTHFVNTNGLDEENHYSSARDVAIMSRELLTHPKITDYTSIWTDELRDGKFQLANTNKLVRFYSGANGLKTGSTSKALCCLSASAERDGMELIAVVLGAPTSDKRFSSARSLLDYGFANYGIKVLISEGEEAAQADVINGTSDTVKAAAAENKSLLMSKAEAKEPERIIYLNDNITAPIAKGDVLGTVEFVCDTTTVGSVNLVAAEDVPKKGICMIIKDIVTGFM